MLLVLLFVCVGWHTMPGDAEVVTSFEGTCSKFFFRDTPPNIRLTSPCLARICQRFKNQYRYATLYDQAKRIPVYSAYIYKPGNGSRSTNWLVEPQLVKFPPDMASEKALLNITLKLLNESQAVWKDYNNLGNYDRGHLNPSCHQPDQDASKATFTLTNIVPQYSRLNKGSWNNYERKTMVNNTQKCKETFAVVGAVPGSNYISGGRVNQPSHLWSAACCKTDNNHFKSWAMIARNDEDAVEELTLGELETRLAGLYGQNAVFLFHSDCPRQ